MLIYKDIISGDELVSDSYPMKDIDDIVYEFEGKSVTISSGIDDSLIGGNASAEDAGDNDVQDTAETKINIVHSHNLVETSFTKKDYIPYLKGYMKRIEKILAEKNPERVEKFKKGAEKFVKEKVLPNFKNWQFFTGELMNPDAMVILMDYREDGLTPYFLLFKDGLDEEKC